MSPSVKIVEVGVDDRDADYVRIDRLQTRLLPDSTQRGIFLRDEQVSLAA